MFLSAYRTCSHPERIELLPYIDDDDFSDYSGDLIRGPRIGLAQAYNHLYKLTSADIVMLCADDINFMTSGWDEEVLDLMPSDLVGVVSYDDLGRPRKENGHPFVGRKFIESLGYLCYEKLNHSCVDNWLVDISKSVDRFFYGQMLIEHLHPKYQKGEWDETYKENSKEKKQNDGVVYLGEEGRREIFNGVKRVRGYLDSLVHR